MVQAAAAPLSPENISVGFSDAILLGVSFVGFGILAVTVYSIVLTRLKNTVDADADTGDTDDEQRLVQADVATLNRAQRRARAKVIMKQQRRAVGAVVAPEDGADAEHEPDDATRPIVSRKERQLAAKAEERLQRQCLAEERQVQQDEAQRLAHERKLQRHAAANQHAAENKATRDKQRDEQRAQWHVFLSSDTKHWSVAEFWRQCQTCRVHALDDVARAFDTTRERVSQRIQQLIAEGRVSGFFHGDDNAIFVAVTDDELDAMAARIQESDTVLTLDTVADLCQGVLDQRNESELKVVPLPLQEQ